MSIWDMDENRGVVGVLLEFGLDIITMYFCVLSYENRDIAIAMSSSRADPVLGLRIPSSCPGWGYLY